MPPLVFFWLLIEFACTDSFRIDVRQITSPGACSHPLCPDWLKVLPDSEAIFQKLKIGAQTKNAMGNQCPGVVRKHLRAQLMEGLKLCKALAAETENPASPQTPTKANSTASTDSGGCQAAAELAKLKKELAGNFESGRPLQEITDELKNVQSQQSKVEAQLKSSDDELQKALQETEDMSSLVKKGMVQRTLRDKFTELQKSWMSEKLLLREKERSLMFDVVMNGEDKPVLSMEEFFDKLEEFVIKSRTWKIQFHKKLDPCVPVMLQKGQRIFFETLWPKLLGSFAKRPSVMDEETYLEFVADALVPKPKAVAFFKKLGYPSFAEASQKAFMRLVSVKQATCTFRAGEMGITYDEKGYVQEISPSSPARACQISQRDQIVKVGDEEYSKNVVVQAEKSGVDYKVLFKVGKHPSIFDEASGWKKKGGQPGGESACQ